MINISYYFAIIIDMLVILRVVLIGIDVALKQSEYQRRNSVKKKKNKSSENIVRMIIRKNTGIERLNVRSITKLYPELGELVKIL